GGLLPVSCDLAREGAPELANLARQVERPREHLASPRRNRGPAARRVLHVHGLPARADELVRAAAEDEDVARAQVLHELLAELADDGAEFVEAVVRPLLRNRPDVRVVDHSGAFL